MEASKVGLMLGLTIRRLVTAMTGKEIETRLVGDNLATIRGIQTEITNWKTRHYAVTASWIRDQTNHEKIDVSHRSGKELVSDALTKILGRTELTRARERLGLLTC